MKRGDMKQRADSILKWLSNLWGSFTKWITPVFSIGAIMVIISVVLIASQKEILQAAGTAMLAAGLTIITTTLTGRESTRQQFAKEANTLRKYTIYGPLFIELKQIYEWLDEAKKKEGRYPYYIFGAGGEPDSTRYARNPLYPTFLEWPQFKQDYRIESFKLRTRTLLDQAQELMVDYNGAMEATINPAVNVLAPHIERAVSTWMGTASFQDWDKRSSGGVIQQNDPLHSWNSILKTQSVSSAADMATNMAKLWLGPYGGLGWFIAGAGDKAAIYIDNSYSTQGGSTLVRPDLSWFQGIIVDAWPELDQLQEINAARVVAEALQTKVEKVENLLEIGIRLIRDQYEGGEPHV